VWAKLFGRGDPSQRDGPPATERRRPDEESFSA
jgi:hypothetical protein